jgi:hypothetical protein
LLTLRTGGGRGLLLARTLRRRVLLRGLAGRRKRPTVRRLLRRAGETLDVLMPKNVTVPERRLLICVVEALQKSNQYND